MVYKLRYDMSFIQGMDQHVQEAGCHDLSHGCVSTRKLIFYSKQRDHIHNIINRLIFIGRLEDALKSCVNVNLYCNNI